MSQGAVCNFEIGSTVQVKCMASRGMLQHERAILVKGIDQFYEAMLDAELVTIDGGDIKGDEERPATIHARVINVNCESVLVELPRQVVTGGRRIWVPKSEVTVYGHSLAASD